MAAEPSSKNILGSEKEEEEEKELEEIELGLSVEKLNLGPKKKLLIMGLGGFLCHRALRRPKIGSNVPTTHRLPDAAYGSFNVYKRPYCEDFMKFCLERFHVGIWSSAREWYMNNALDAIMIGLRGKLLFAWDQTECTKTCFFDPVNEEKPIFLKELKQVLRENKDFQLSNTLLIDNEPYKALLNPPHTAIFPNEYKVDDVNVRVLGSGSELRMFLEELAEAKDVASFIKQHPFGKPAISSTHPNWDFYSKIITKYE